MLLFYVYYVLSYLMLPVVCLRLVYKSKEHKGYLKNIKERFSVYNNIQNNKNFIWVHAVSVGETKASETLIQNLVQSYPSFTILLTCTTPTGRDIGKQLFSQYIADNRLIQCYIPYDAPLIVKRFYKYFKPKLGIILESEIWPHLLKYSHLYKIPTILANARMSPKSYKRMSAFQPYIQKILNYINFIACQTQTDADYYSKLGASRIKVMGNLKFDCLPNQEILNRANLYKNIKQQDSKKPVVLLASTREDEEEILIKAWIYTGKKYDLIILPRHMHRLPYILKYLNENKILYILRSELESNLNNNLSADIFSVIIGDTMGEMPFYIELSDIVIMGGSWMPFGGQNILEACMQGKNVLVGEHTYNFLEVTEKAVAMKACFRFSNAADAFNSIENILNNSEYKENSIKFVNSYKGATNRLMNFVNEYIPR